MPNSKIGIVGLIGLVIGFVVGYGMGRVSTGSPVNPLSNSGSYQDGYNAAKKKLADSGLFPPAPTQATTLGGSVMSVGTASFTFDVNLGPTSPLDDAMIPKTRTVTVTSATVITRQVAKPPQDYQKELAAAQKAGTKELPSPYTTETIKLSDIHVGDLVAVTADHNILYEAAFKATAVSLNGAGAATPPPATPPIAPPKP